MAELFTDINELKTHIGGAVNMTVEMDSLAPTIADAAQRHLVPHLSQGVYQALVVAHASGAPSPSNLVLIKYVQRALAKLSIYEYSKIGGVMLGEGGIHRTESETRRAAYRYQETDYRQYMLESGYDSLYAMLGFLSSEAATYTDWANSTEGLGYRSRILNSPTVFRNLGTATVDGYTYECLRPIIDAVEATTITPMLPKSWWSGFITRYLAGTLTMSERQLLRLFQKSIAPRTVSEAMSQHQVRQEGGRIVVLEQFGEQRQTNASLPTLSTSGIPATRAALWADRHTNEWVSFIRTNDTAFSGIFSTASGGTNADSDAWVIETADDIEARQQLEADRLSRPIYRL